MEDNIDSPNYAPTVTFAIRKATIKFINSLNQNQKNKALFSFNSGDERFKWSYVPIDRNGLLLSEITSLELSNEKTIEVLFFEYGKKASGPNFVNT